MTKEQKMVEEFHKTFGFAIATSPSFPDHKTVQLREKLIVEEGVTEFSQANANANMVEAVDALIDTLYVTYGALLTYGVDAEPIFEVVHQSNMAKKGGYRREDGKWMKPDNWQPPDILGELRKQGFKG